MLNLSISIEKVLFKLHAMKNSPKNLEISANTMDIHSKISVNS